MGMDWITRLHPYCLRITGNRWDAEDLAQSAAIKVLEAIRRRPDRPLSRAFLYRVAKNAWIDIQRRQRLIVTPLEGAAEFGETDPQLSSRELLEQLAERLPPKKAVILLLMDVFDFTAKETAAYVRMQEAAVQVALGRARQRLRAYAREPEIARARHREPEGPVHFDALVDAFRRRDPEAIHRAYLGLSRAGAQLALLRETGGSLQFVFRDPDGNRFRVVSR
ncbi:sigma-70 family RNA polymerase sigma factor [Cohnella nanjingensis]|uniref:Sigma-70 family RNA polymerase sigma factor n=1 Tax=Cohnella nanjingensis TaxID=1387779 RepID=A0A7X0RNL9_9BACL|nr:sigma-70 family RNA polymerase sigma factor [Cohnella nanjingensis]MBB6669555.1 sigma-70 family RNA polymerase sigma factor [Cohnella nanjingensis]